MRMNIPSYLISKDTVPRDHWDEQWPPDLSVGYLYVIEFDSGWVKVGLTTNWQSRRATHVREYGRRYGWEMARPPWKSCCVSNERPETGRRSDLARIEARLIREARRTSDGRKLNPFVRGHGRDRSRPSETETFHGCSFDYLIAYADVLARTDALR